MYHINRKKQNNNCKIKTFRKPWQKIIAMASRLLRQLILDLQKKLSKRWIESMNTATCRFYIIQNKSKLKNEK